MTRIQRTLALAAPAVALFAVPATAGEVIQHASECIVLEAASVVYSTRGLASYSSVGAFLECGVPHGSAAYADQYTKISVWGYDRNPSSDAGNALIAQECVQYWDGSGARCSSRVSSSGTGPVNLAVPKIVTVADRDDFVFVEVGIPAYVPNSASSALGIWYQW